MTFIVNLKLDCPILFPSIDIAGPCVLIRQGNINMFTQIDINMVSFNISEYGILDGYFEYWKFIKD